jgi:hypothetical protein
MSLQLTGDFMSEVVMAAALVATVNRIHLPGRHVARR